MSLALPGLMLLAKMFTGLPTPACKYDNKTLTARKHCLRHNKFFKAFGCYSKAVREYCAKSFNLLNRRALEIV